MVVAVDRGRYTGRGSTGQRGGGDEGARARPRRSVVVGDRVALVGDVSGRPTRWPASCGSSRARSTLRRTADDTDPVERVIVANADQLVIVTALADPEPRPRLIDRCLVAAYDAGLRPLLCLTKSDLASPDALLETYGALDVAARRHPPRATAGRAARAPGTTGSACWSATPASASRRWSTRSSPAPAARPAASTR